MRQALYKLKDGRRGTWGEYLGIEDGALLSTRAANTLHRINVKTRGDLRRWYEEWNGQHGASSLAIALGYLPECGRITVTEIALWLDAA